MAPHLVPDPAVAHNLALALIASSNAPLLLLDGDIKLVAASASFCKAYQIDPATVPGATLAGLGAGEWKLPQLASLLRTATAGHSEIDAYEMDLVRHGMADRRLVLNAKKLFYGDAEAVRLILTVSDVTDARAAEKIKENLVRDKEVLLQELHHRVANSLQIIASVLLQSARNVQSEETRSHLVDAHQRVMSVASLQKQLAVTRMGEVELRPYFTALCQSIAASMIRDRGQLSLEVRSDESVIAADTSVSLGLIVTELVINALKHAFPENRKGTITVEYHSRGPNWTLSVGDDGVGMPTDFEDARAGLGTSIVQALAKQLSARVSVENASPGTEVSIVHHYVPVLVGQEASLANRAV